MNLLCCPNCLKPIPKGIKAKKNFTCKNCKKQIPIINDNIPVLINNWDNIKDLVDQAQKSTKAHWYEESHQTQWQGPYRHHLLKRRRYTDDVLKKFVKEKKNKYLNFLDAGCGDGEHLKWMENYSRNLYGSDYNLTRISRAKNVRSAKLCIADLTDYPAKDNSFDFIFFNHVLEHIPNDVKALEEIYRITKPGGMVMIGVPNEGAFFWQLAYKLQPRSRETTDHVQFYTIKNLSPKCKQAGFNIQEAKPIGWGLPHWWLDSQIRGYSG